MDVPRSFFVKIATRNLTNIADKNLYYLLKIYKKIY